jgi:tetratricopeptide (TPR) repeat protein
MLFRRLALPLPLVAALVLGAPGCGDDPEARARDEAERAALRSDLERTRKDLERTAQALQSVRDESRNLRGEVALLAERVGALESRAPGGAAAATDGVAPSVAKPAAPDRKAMLAEMKSLQEKVFAGTATDEEQQRFWELARSADVLDELMKRIEAKVAQSPDDSEVRMQLANAYVAKLMSLPPGPEQGLWSGKAVQQWEAVLKKDPEHWDARFSLAFNWSMWPDFLNKTPDAIREFEKVREVQERGAPEEKHAQTYLQLSRLYQKQGKSDKAKDVLRAGLARHPDDAELKKALGSLDN